MQEKINQPDDPGPDVLEAIRTSQMQYKTRWNVYHTLLVIGVWGIWLCTMYALKHGWGG
jgi:hypothetical protein